MKRIQSFARFLIDFEADVWSILQMAFLCSIIIYAGLLGLALQLLCSIVL